jgi:hypothetical protein
MLESLIFDGRENQVNASGEYFLGIAIPISSLGEAKCD